MMSVRKIVKIDEERCNGCGLCVPACAEGALQVIEGKARLVSDIYCDGLGACLGECPRDAITIEARDAEGFDPLMVEERLKSMSQSAHSGGATGMKEMPCNCPGSAVTSLGRNEGTASNESGEPLVSELANWPVQLRLVPVFAPYLEGADLLIAADCVPFAFADFHRRFVKGKVLLCGCPKLDDAEYYRQKLAEMLDANSVESIEVAYMEVPCCYGMVHLVTRAIEQSGKPIDLKLAKVGVRGELLDT